MLSYNIDIFCPNKSTTISQVGLCINMKNVTWFDNSDQDTFFPRCYRLSHDDDKAAFVGEKFDHTELIFNSNTELIFNSRVCFPHFYHIKFLFIQCMRGWRLWAQL